MSLDKQGDVRWRYPFKLPDKSLQKSRKSRFNGLYKYE